MKYQNGDKVVPLICGVRMHELWHNLKFWKKLFDDNVNTEITLFRSKLLKDRKLNVDEKNTKEKLIIGNKLTECMNYMLILSLSHDLIKRFVNENGRALGVSDQQLKAMLVTSNELK